MKNRINRSLVLSSLVCLAPLAATFFLWNRLPDRMVTSWGATGLPQDEAPKALVALGMPLLFFGANLLLRFAIRADPKRENAARSLRSISGWVMPLMSVGMYAMVVLNALSGNLNPSTWARVFAGLLIMLFGNYLPKSHQSYTVGIKTPWTLHSEEIWNRTHRLAGPLWVVGGLAMAIGPFFPFGGILSAILMGIAVLVPFVYSYWLYRNEGR